MTLPRRKHCKHCSWYYITKSWHSQDFFFEIKTKTFVSRQDQDFYFKTDRDFCLKTRPRLLSQDRDFCLKTRPRLLSQTMTFVSRQDQDFYLKTETFVSRQDQDFYLKTKTSVSRPRLRPRPRLLSQDEDQNFFVLNISALEVFLNVMRYINPRFT